MNWICRIRQYLCKVAGVVVRFGALHEVVDVLQSERPRRVLIGIALPVAEFRAPGVQLDQRHVQWNMRHAALPVPDASGTLGFAIRDAIQPIKSTSWVPPRPCREWRH